MNTSAWREVFLNCYLKKEVLCSTLFFKLEGSQLSKTFKCKTFFAFPNTFILITDNDRKKIHRQSEYLFQLFSAVTSPRNGRTNTWPRPTLSFFYRFLIPRKQIMRPILNLSAMDRCDRFFIQFLLFLCHTQPAVALNRTRNEN